MNRNLLFRKLQNLGISNHLLDVLRSIYTENIIQVCSEDVLSDKIRQTIGVPQGDKLSPLLFAIFITDLNPILTKTGCSVVFYADDLAIVSHNIQVMRTSLERLYLYCKQNSLKVNTKKTTLMKFRNGGSISSYDDIMYDSERLSYVSSFCYLGIVLTNRLTANLHLKRLSNKAKSSITSLQSKVSFDKISFFSAQRLLNSVVIPAASYGLELFNEILTSFTIDQHLTKITGLFF